MKTILSIIYNIILVTVIMLMGMKIGKELELGLWTVVIVIVLITVYAMIRTYFSEESSFNKWEARRDKSSQERHLKQKSKAEQEICEKEKLEKEKLDKIRRERINRINDEFEKFNAKLQVELTNETEKRKTKNPGSTNTSNSYGDNRCSNHNSNQLYKDVGGDGCDDVYLSDGVWISSDGSMHDGR